MVVPSRMDGSKPPDWTGFPENNVPNNFDIPEVEILSDSEESIWELTDPLRHNRTFIANELRNRRIEEARARHNRFERLNATRERRLRTTIRQIRILNEEGEYADDSRYNWEFHNDRMADLSVTRDNLVRQIARYRIRSQRNDNNRNYF